MGGWMYGWMGGCVAGWEGGWVGGRLGRWVSGRQDGWVAGWMGDSFNYIDTKIAALQQTIVEKKLKKDKKKMKKS